MNNLYISFYITEDGFEYDPSDSFIVSEEDKLLYNKYCLGKGPFLVNLAFEKIVSGTPSLMFLKHMVEHFLNKVILSDRINFNEVEDCELSDDDIAAIIDELPYITGCEFVDKAWLDLQHQIFITALVCEFKVSGQEIRSFLVDKGCNTVIPSRVYFHLVEATNSEYPFAFLATYTTKVNGKIAHVPLKNAIKEFYNQPNELNVLISSITQAAKSSTFVKTRMESGEIYYPLKIDDKEAYTFLQETEIFKECGIVCRIPKWYNESSVAIGFDFDEKLQFSGKFFSPEKINFFTPQLIYHGVEITIDEARKLLIQNEGLHLIKNRWVELNHDDLKALLQEYEGLCNSGTTILDIIRNKSGVGQNTQDVIINYEFTHKDWLTNLLTKQFNDNIEVEIPSVFINILRDYQKDAYKWLWGMTSMGFGVCLADDMGLGKTIEVLAFLEKLRTSYTKAHVLIIVPATLVSNWESEIKKFDNNIDYFVLRGNNEPANGIKEAFATITTYQTALRSSYISSVDWDVIILDEAQAIKNHYTSQTRKIKSLNSSVRIAMTGTPIENNILELWSLFDFLNPGLLGSREEFKQYYLNNEKSILGLKRMVQPFVLRRVKTDKKIINDLPEKNEIDVTINLTKEQIVLYRKVVSEMNSAISESNKRRQILVMSALTKLKQICNHPSQYYGNQIYDLESSGKFVVLKEICETIYSKREKVLVFTQYKEIIPALDTLLASVFKIKGTTIDGDTSMAARKTRIEEFQAGRYPYMVLSLKTAGVGLNLTEAQNVIHFDRWWNPAVENQATDRVYRIGQKKSVMVYKFVSADTIEEIINDMLKKKQGLADDIINNIDTNIFAKLSADEIISAARYRGIDEEV